MRRLVNIWLYGFAFCLSSMFVHGVASVIFLSRVIVENKEVININRAFCIYIIFLIIGGIIGGLKKIRK